MSKIDENSEWNCTLDIFTRMSLIWIITVTKALGYSSATLGHNYKMNNLLRAIFTSTEAPNLIIQGIN